jgi:phenylpropionate dioxygenase-like ring-hydroxylating dioxygenase large terminal subunit
MRCMAIPWSGATRTSAAPGASGWYPVAHSAEVSTTPLQVGAGGRAYVVVRLTPDGEVTAVSARCPHRLVPMAAARVVDGRLQCPYHGWRFNAEGRCVEIPSLGPDGTPPPRADLTVPWAVEERDGWVWLAPERTATHRPPRSGGSRPAPDPEPVPDPAPPSGPVFGNLDPSLEHAWHPVALTEELVDGGYAQARLLGRTWTVHRRDGELDADPPAWGVQERYGVVWLAPREPREPVLDVPETRDPRFAAAWLPLARSAAPAGPLADNLLDVAHVPFVHPGTVRTTVEEVSAFVVTPEAGGFRGVHEQEPDDPHGAGRHRVTYVYRVPFQLLVRLEELDAGTVRTVLFVLQPEDADSTRIYTCLLVCGAGDTVPGDVLAREEQVLAEDLALQSRMDSQGLPLLLRDELHVPADRLGVALRRSLADFAAAGATPDLQHRASV